MIYVVKLGKQAQKDLIKCPLHIAIKFKYWVRLVEFGGLEAARLIKSFHDEPLKGQRQGQRSIRLSQAYRAIYVICADGTIEFAEVQEIHKHAY
jgi:toxin HigB-1